MKVLHVISSGGMYGAEAVILNLSGAMNGTGRDLSSLAVFAHAGQPIPVLHQVATARGIGSELIACQGQIDWSVPRRIAELAARTGADVVHAHGYKADIYAFLALRGRNGAALVSTCHTWYDNDLAVRFYGAADRWVLRHFDQVIAVSGEVEARLLNAGVRREKVHLIRNGIDVYGFAGAADRRNRVRDNGRMRVGLVGRLAREKGVDVFLRAVARVAPQVPCAEFVVAGDGPDRAALERLLAELGVHGAAKLVGQQANMRDFFAGLDLLVSASRQEGLPIALLEGMASGLPVIATRVGAVPEVVVDGETGVLVAPGDPEALGEAMRQLLTEPARREDFGEAGRRRVLQEFSAQRMAADYVGVYRQALSGRVIASAEPHQSSA